MSYPTLDAPREESVVVAWWLWTSCVLSVDGRTVLAQPVDRVVIDVSNADVQLIGVPGPVAVDVDVGGWSHGEVTTVVDNGVLFIDYVCGSADSCGGDVIVTLPPRTPSQTSLQDGNLVLADVRGSAVANLRNGRVTALRHGAGPLVVAANGGVDLQFDDRPDRVDVETEAGDVRLALPRGSYALDAQANRIIEDDGIVEDPESLHRLRVRTPGTLFLSAR